MADTQFQSLAKLVAEKLNEIIVKVNTHNSNKAEVSGQTFTGDVVTPNLSVTNTITTEDIDQFSRQGFAAVGGGSSNLALSAAGSSSGTVKLQVSLTYLT